MVAGASAELPHTLMLAHVKASFMSRLDMLGGLGGGAGVGGGGGGGGVDNVRWYCFPITLLSTLGRLQFEERNAHH